MWKQQSIWDTTFLDQELTGGVHIEKTVKTASKRLHYLTVIARHGLPADELITIDTTLIRPCLDYSSSVLLVGCSKEQQAELERVQTPACKNHQGERLETSHNHCLHFTPHFSTASKNESNQSNKVIRPTLLAVDLICVFVE